MAARKARYLDRNDGTQTPVNLLFFDTESFKRPHPTIKDKSVLSLRLWAAVRCRIEKGEVTRRFERHGTDADSFWSFVDEALHERMPLWAFAHNLGFDLTQLDFWRQLDARRFTIGSETPTEPTGGRSECVPRRGTMCLDNNPTYLILYNDRRKLVFVDSANYWPLPLRCIGDSLGIRKHAIPDQAGSEDDWLRYCLQDARIVETAVSSLMAAWRAADSGVFKLTAASLAMTNFQHLCDVRTPDGKAVDIVCEPDAEHHEIEREAYYGGRVQCYYVGSAKGRIYHLDCNSLYPAVMSQHSYPRRFAGQRKEMSHGELSAKLACYGVVARCLLNTRHQTYPVRIDGRQYHCTGTFWTTLCGPELQRALQGDAIKRLHGVQWYSIAPLFKAWVNHWFGRKTDAKRLGERGRAEHEFCKLILNSLSGKFAQRSKGWRDRPGEYPPIRWGAYIGFDPKTHELQKCRAVGGNKQVMIETGEPRHAFPLISAYITAYGREYMRETIELCPPGSVYYMATDSLICDTNAYDALSRKGCIDEYTLGKFRVIGEYAECEIFGPNHYRLEGKTVASGVFGKYLISKAENKRVELWEQLQSLISKEPDGTVVTTTIDVPSVTPNYRGVIGPDGYWTPYRLTFDPDFGDLPPKGPYSLRAGVDMEAGRILLNV